jgi:hypothetical protein
MGFVSSNGRERDSLSTFPSYFGKSHIRELASGKLYAFISGSRILIFYCVTLTNIFHGAEKYINYDEEQRQLILAYISPKQQEQWTHHNRRFEVLSAMIMKCILWDVMPCGLVEVHLHFGGPCCPHLQGLKSKPSKQREYSCTACYLLNRLILSPKNGGSASLRNVDKLLPPYMAPQAKR